jgi:hypothetical protein
VVDSWGRFFLIVSFVILPLLLFGHLLTPLSLAVALGCRTNTTLHITDQEPMFDLMQRNIALNDLNLRVVASIYDWGAPTPSQLLTHPDIILAADCVYFEPAFPLLQQTLKDLIGENTVCYFCFKKRRRADLQFMKVARKMFDVKKVDDDPDREVYTRKGLFLCVPFRHRYRLYAEHT